MDNQLTPKQKREAYRRMLVRYHHGLVFRIVAILVVLLFVINLIVPSKDYSDTENRSLAKRPGIMAGGLADGTYFEDFDTYYSDQFVLRDQFVKLKFIGNMLFHIRESSGVYIGKRGYQFEIPEAANEKLTKSTIKKINEFYTLNENIKTRMMIVPASAVILKNRLPANAAVTDQAGQIEAYYDKIHADIDTIDVTGILKKADPENLYYKTDHHWTSPGAYTVFKKSASALGIDAPVGYDRYLVSTSFKGTLSSKSGDFIGKDDVEVYIPKSRKVNYYVSYPDAKEKRASIFEPEKLKEKDHYTVFFGGNHPLVEINTTANTGRNLLVIKDSFANAFMQFLTPYYDRIIMVDPRYYYDNLNMVISNYNINEILYLYSADTIFTDTSLSDTLEAAIEAQKEEEKAEKKEKKEKETEETSTDAQDAQETQDTAAENGEETAEE